MPKDKISIREESFYGTGFDDGIRQALLHPEQTRRYLVSARPSLEILELQKYNPRKGD